MIRYWRMLKLIGAIIICGHLSLLRDWEWIKAYGRNPNDLDPVP